MWSSSRALRSLGLAAALAVAPALAACSGFTPVYGDHGLGQHQVALLYGAPSNRLEQIIYEDLSLRLGKATGAAPTLTVTVQQSTHALTSNSLGSAPLYVPVEQQEAVVTAAIRLVDVNGKVLFSGSRSAASDYTINPQVFASDEAADNASRNAAHSLADIIRLTVLGALAK
jgi:hypothetical protein